MMLFIILEKLRFLSKLAFIIKYRSITTIDFTRYDTAWILYNLILPPLLINLVSDIVNFKNQMIYGFISTVFDAVQSPPLCLVPPLWNWKNLGLWKNFQQNFFCKKLCLGTYCEQDFLFLFDFPI